MQDLFRRFLRILMALAMVIVIGSLLFYAGYTYGWYQANWSKRLVQRAPFVEEYSNVKKFPEGAYRERDVVVLFGKVDSFDKDRGILNVIVYDSQRFVIKLNKNTRFDLASIPSEEVNQGDYVRLDMKYSEPFVANRIVFTRR